MSRSDDNLPRILGHLQQCCTVMHTAPDMAAGQRLRHDGLRVGNVAVEQWYAIATGEHMMDDAVDLGAFSDAEDFVAELIERHRRCNPHEM